MSKETTYAINRMASESFECDNIYDHVCAELARSAARLLAHSERPRQAILQALEEVIDLLSARELDDALMDSPQQNSPRNKQELLKINHCTKKDRLRMLLRETFHV